MTKSRIAAGFFSLAIAFAQTPNFSGVWKPNADKSKFSGPPPSSYLMLIDQQGGKITETIDAGGQHGTHRSVLTFSTDASKPSRNYSGGTPMQTAVALDGNTLKLDSKLAGEHGGTSTETWTLSPDGNVLTIVSSTKMGEHSMDQTLVLDKQPDAAGESIRKPEETAAVHYKNVQIAKDMPASQFIDMMRSFTWSLGVQCDHCHVQGNFAADDKDDKKMARKMMVMVQNANMTTFGGQPEIRCYTCHRGQHMPVSAPAFQ